MYLLYKDHPNNALYNFNTILCFEGRYNDTFQLKQKLMPEMNERT